MAKRKSHKTAFTLLEILVVLAIISVLLYMIVQGMSNFRRSVELQQASDRIVSAINETKNFASNNILPDDVVIEDNKIYGYRLTPNVENNNIVREVCSKVVGSLTWDCSISSKKDDLVTGGSVQLQNIIITPQGCTSALLVNMTNDWLYEDINSGFVDQNYCVFELSHKQDMRIFRTFIFDAETNTFVMKYEDAN